MGVRKNRNGKRLYICLAALLALLLICGSGIFILYRGQDDKKVQEITVSLESLASPYAVLIDAETGTVLGSKNPQQKIFPASMAKIMTVLTAIEQIRDCLLYTSKYSKKEQNSRRTAAKENRS